MADFIEREKILRKLRGECLAHYPPYCIMWILSAANEVANIPAADVRPVVLCRDCKYAQMTIDGLCKYCDRLTEIGVDDAVYLSEDFFCAAGEKRDES